MSIKACNNCGKYNTDVISFTIDHEKGMIVLELLCGDCHSTIALVFSLVHAEVIKPKIIIHKGAN